MTGYSMRKKKPDLRQIALTGRPPTGYRKIPGRSGLSVIPEERILVTEVIIRGILWNQSASLIGRYIRNLGGYKNAHRFEKRRIQRILDKAEQYLGYINLGPKQYGRAYFISEPVITKAFLRSTSLSEKDIKNFDKALQARGYPGLLPGDNTGISKNTTLSNEKPKGNTRKSLAKVTPQYKHSSKRSVTDIPYILTKKNRRVI